MPAPLTTFRPGRLAELPYVLAIEADSEQLFTDFGLHFRIGDEHPFVLAERESWRLGLVRGDVCFALSGDYPVGFYVISKKDGRGYLEQLAVRPEYGRRGIGRALIENASEVCRARGQTELWLTTYDHVPWNRPFYEHAGFSKVLEADCGREIAAALAAQRAVLPEPHRRVAMRRIV